MSLYVFHLLLFFSGFSSLNGFNYRAPGSSSLKKKFGLLKLNPELTLDDTIFSLNNSIHITNDFKFVFKAKCQKPGCPLILYLVGSPFC